MRCIREAQQAEQQRKIFLNKAFFFKLPSKSDQISTPKASGETPGDSRRQAGDRRTTIVTNLLPPH